MSGYEAIGVIEFQGTLTRAGVSQGTSVISRTKKQICGTELMIIGILFKLVLPKSQKRLLLFCSEECERVVMGNQMGTKKGSVNKS